MSVCARCNQLCAAFGCPVARYAFARQQRDLYPVVQNAFHISFLLQNSERFRRTPDFQQDTGLIPAPNIQLHLAVILLPPGDLTARLLCRGHRRLMFPAHL